MSKIRNLFNKIKSKKKSSQDLDDIFLEEEQLDEDDLFEEDEDIEIPDEPDIDSYLEDDEEVETVAASEDLTGEIDVSELPPSSMPPAKQEATGEVQLTSGIDDDGYVDEYVDEYDDEDVTNEIDLEEGSLTLKDRMEHMSLRVKDKFRNLNTKDLNKAYKKDMAANKLQDFTSKINLADLKGKASSFNWNSLPSKFFADENKPKVHRYFQMGMLVFTTFAIAKLSGSLLGGSKKYNDLGRESQVVINDDNKIVPKDINKISQADLFQTQEEEKPVDTKPKEIPKTQCLSANKKSSLNVKLVDTIVLQDSVKSIASVQLNSKKELLMAREGQTVESMKIGRIEKSRMIFRNLQSQDCEYIEQKESKRSKRIGGGIRTMNKTKAAEFRAKAKKIDGIQQEGNTFKVKRDFLKTKLADINTILTEAKGIPIKNPDGTISFKIVDVDPGGIFAYLGVQNGDVITSINGEPIKEINEVMSLFGKITSLNNLSLGFDRQGDNVTQNYNIE